MQKDTIRNKIPSKPLLSKSQLDISKLDHQDQRLLRNKRYRKNTLKSNEPEANSVSKLEKKIIKTNKGAKKASSQMESSKRCDICLDFIHFSNDKTTTCSICNCIIHRSCLSSQLSEEIDLDLDEYTCNRCYEAVVDDCSIEKFK